MTRLGMNPDVKDWIQVGAWAVAILGGLVAAYRALAEMRENRRWRKANAAKELITDIHRDPRASTAVLMMDWAEGQHEYQTEPGHKETLSFDEVMTALKKEPSQCGDVRDRYVRDCFDWFFYYVDRIEHYIQTGLIDFRDVAPVFKPYFKIVEKHRAAFDAFAKLHDYELIGAFWGRYASAARGRWWTRWHGVVRRPHTS